MFHGILIWIIKSWANCVLSKAGVSILSNFLCRDTRRTLLGNYSEVWVSFFPIHLAFSIRWLCQTHELLRFKVSAGSWVCDVSWWLENCRSCVGGTKPVNFCNKRVHLFVVTCYDNLHFLSCISARSWIFVFFVCLISFHHRIERRNTKS